MAASNVKAGRMACETCSDRVWVKRTSGGKLAYRCEGCGSGHFAEAGDRAYRKWTAAMEPVEGEQPAPAEPAAPPPAPRRAAQAFNLGGL